MPAECTLATTVPGVVERPRGTDRARKLRQLRRDEPDLPVLVLDVDLERVQSVRLQRGVLVDLPFEPGERRADMDASDLARIGPRHRRLVDADGRLRRLLRRGRALAADLRRAEPDPRAEREQDDRRGEPPAPALDKRLAAPIPELLVRVQAWMDVPTGHGGPLSVRLRH
jgi:hypothetical protein